MLSLLSGCAEGFRFDPSGRESFAPSRGYLLEPGPFSASNTSAITVAPGEIVAPINSEVVIVSTVYGPTGQPMPGRRVEWMIAQGGVGEFVTLADRDETSFGHSVRNLPKKVNNTFAIGESSAVNTLITRGTPSRADDVALTVGQTWITATSTIEGTSHVTAFGPDVHSWDRRRSTATISWVDAKWVPPPPAVVKTGDKHLLTTTVTRQTDGTPLVGWRVRYEILNQPVGTAATSSEGSQVIEVTTNDSGKAIAEIGQPSPTATTVPVNVQLFRPSDPANPNSKRALIGSVNTQVTWADAAPISTPSNSPITNPPLTTPPITNLPITSPPTTNSSSIDLTITPPSQPVSVGQEALFVINITNRGNSPGTGWTLTDTYSDGLQFRSPAPTGGIERKLGEIAPGKTQTVNLRFIVTQPGQQCHDAVITTPEGQRATARSCVTGITPTLASFTLNVTGPPQVYVGTAALFSTVVTNIGTTNILHLRLITTPDAPLLSDANEAEDGRDRIEDSKGHLVWDIANLEPGKSRTFRFKSVPNQPASRATVQSEVYDDANHVGKDAATIDVLPPNTPSPTATNLTTDVVQTVERVKVGGETKYQIVVTNAGQTTDKNVVVRVAIPPQLKVTSAVSIPPILKSTPDATNTWTVFEGIKELGPGQQMAYEIAAVALQSADAVVSVQVTSQFLSAPINKSKNTTIFAE